MRFGYTIIYVTDVAAIVAFYAHAFGIVSRLLHESGTYAELETGPTALAFSSLEYAQALFGSVTPHEPHTTPAAVEIGLVTEDVDAAYAHAVAAGAAPVLPPVLKEWGQTVAYVRDLNGFLVELCTPLG